MSSPSGYWRKNVCDVPSGALETAIGSAVITCQGHENPVFWTTSQRLVTVADPPPAIMRTFWSTGSGGAPPIPLEVVDVVDEVVEVVDVVVEVSVVVVVCAPAPPSLGIGGEPPSSPKAPPPPSP